MDDVKRTKPEEQIHAELVACLEEQEDWTRRFLASGGALSALGAPPRDVQAEEIELDLDADLVKWFRALGPSHDARVCAVLRVYARDMWPWRG